MNQILKGLLAGAIATAPMTVVMAILHRWPRPEREAVPPHQITMRLLRRVEQEPENAPARTFTTTISHFGFGAAFGALYAPFAEQVPGRVPGPPAVKGAAYGVLVWLVSYLGWLPASGVLRPATRQSLQRNIMMIVAHLVWGACLGLLMERGQSQKH
jgi:uncharacterized membrane protein YagU involved in acid resistance